MLLRSQTADKENNPRGINRHKFTIPEAEEALQQPVVQALLDLCKFRNSHPAFNGKVCAVSPPLLGSSRALPRPASCLSGMTAAPCLGMRCSPAGIVPQAPCVATPYQHLKALQAPSCR